MKIPLAEMTRRATKTQRAKAVIRAIEPTAAQVADLAALYSYVIKVWARYTQQFIIPAYRRTVEQERQRSADTRDSVQDIQIAVNGAENYSLQASVQFGQGLKNWADRLTRWHLARFTANIKYATNIDLSTMLGESDSAQTVEQAIARNVDLVRNVSDTVRAKISSAVFAGTAARTPVREVAKQINEALAGQKARALRIASDQTVKLAAQLDRERLEQVGVDRFEWMHSRKAHPRKEHVARNGLVYKWDDPRVKGDLPGHAPFCGCKAKGVLVLDEAVVKAEAEPRSRVLSGNEPVPAGFTGVNPYRTQTAVRYSGYVNGEMLRGSNGVGRVFATPEAASKAVRKVVPVTEPTPVPAALPPVETAALRAVRLDTEQRNYVLENGRKSGTEYLTSFDYETGEIIGRNVGVSNYVGFTPEFEAAIADQKRHIIAHHNHPSSSSFSTQDLLMLEQFRGMRGLYAHGHNGAEYYAERGRWLFTQEKFSKAARLMNRFVTQEIKAGNMTEDDAASGMFQHVIMQLLERVNVIKYRATLAGKHLEAYERSKAAIEAALRKAAAEW